MEHPGLGCGYKGYRIRDAVANLCDPVHESASKINACWRQEDSASSLVTGSDMTLKSHRLMGRSMRHQPQRCRSVVLFLSLIGALSAPATAQGARFLFPDRSLMPMLFAGPRDPVTKADLLYVTENPNAFDGGVEVEVALGVTLPVFLLAGESTRNAVVVGVEASAFARFTLQVLERELVATDWTFAVPVVWHRGDHWVSLRYYHTSSHMGDEYARRFDVQGINFARDAAEVLGFVQLFPAAGVYAGARWSYNVHPEDSGRWTLRAGTQLGSTEREGWVLPYGAADVEMESDTDWRPRVHLQAGMWLPTVAGRRALRFGLGLLTGPSPLGQFREGNTTQVTLGLSGNL
jgi:hypothetical protein